MLEFINEINGGLTAQKYVSLNSISKATTTGDRLELHNIGAFISETAGKNIRYQMNFE